MTDLRPDHEPGSGVSPAILEAEADLAARNDAAARAEVNAASLSLGRRLRDPRTLISLALPIVVIVLIALTLRGRSDIEDLPAYIGAANPLLLLAGLAIYYVSFPLRGYRWSMLLRGSGERVSVRDATEILYVSWLVNCVVPAKLGDIYRAYLLRMNQDVSLSRTLGTVFIERIFDVFAIAILGLAAGFWSFRDGFDPYVQFVLGVGVVVIIALAAGVFLMRSFGRQLIARLPLPQKVTELYDRFEEGVFALPARQLPGLGLITGAIWGCESMRLFFVIQALGFTDIHLGLSGVVFVALAAALLTAVPLTPGGLGVVQAGVIGILTYVYQVPLAQAGAITITDWALSVGSVIIFGAIVYIFSDKTKGLRVDARLTAAPRPNA
ncbi:MAG TPA: lysylphosphatidylglycerol synthase transmembrane domain-containing protein [Candidatus Limnocylindrales bacterium]|nr:lysylphosphatidylglycerol synthase transmembrane domain-containing protein [Candidatus Limnocylindrales bacterium]